MITGMAATCMITGMGSEHPPRVGDGRHTQLDPSCRPARDDDRPEGDESAIGNLVGVDGERLGEEMGVTANTTRFGPARPWHQ